MDSVLMFETQGRFSVVARGVTPVLKRSEGTSSPLAMGMRSLRLRSGQAFAALRMTSEVR
jgi:hypothetical protein